MQKQSLHWVLQSNLIKESVFSEIKSALTADGISFEEVKIIPFSDELPEIKESQDLKVFYGTTTLILNAYEKGIYGDGIFYNKEIFSLRNYFDKWKSHMLNFDSEIGTFKDILKSGNNEGDWFVRPIYDDKSFSGNVMSFDEIKKLEASLSESNNPYLDADTLVAISKPKEIIKEWRHFIVDKKVISSSKYAENGQVNKSSVDVPDELLDFVNERCSEYVPNDIFVMDIALYNNCYKIVECNCFNDTGFYEHDISAIIKAVNDFLKCKIEL